MGVQWGEVDGVPALFGHHGAVQGPLQMCLLFGVGRLDEELHNAGITHVVEHLALHAVDDPTLTWNGQVTPTATRFVAAGDPDQLVSFFGAVARALRDLPAARLAEERRILQVEGDRRVRDQVGLDLSLRFGPRGPGLLGWSEYGLRRLGEAEVVRWAAERFTATNAVVWSSGPLPAGLSLAALPAGPRTPRRALAPRALAPRQWHGADTKLVSASVLSGDTRPVGLAMEIVRQRAFDTLRRHDAISYAVEHAQLRVGATQVLDTIVADGTGDDLGRVRDDLHRVLDGFFAEGPRDDELATLRTIHRRRTEDPRHLLGFMEAAANRWLLGLPSVGLEELDADTESMTTERLGAAYRASTATLVSIGPRAEEGPPPGWVALEQWSSGTPAPGHELRPLLGREKGSLFVGEAGVTWTPDRVRHRTVAWGDVAAALAWDSGARVLIGTDGVSVSVLPWNWAQGEPLSGFVDHWVHPDLQIPMGEGSREFRRDPLDAESAVSFRWLASVMGAAYRMRRVDLLVRTDGLFVLNGGGPLRRGARVRAKELQSTEPAAIVAGHPEVRWIRPEEIRSVRLHKKLAPDRWRWTLTVATDRRTLRIELERDRQAEVARDGFERMRGVPCEA